MSNIDKLIEQNETIIRQNRMIITLLSKKEPKKSAKDKYKEKILKK